MTRTCTRCGLQGDLGDFYRQSSRKDGLRSECKNCTKERNRRYYVEEGTPQTARKSDRRAQSKRWREENRDRMRELKDAWAKKNPDRVKAHHATFRQRHPHAGWESRYRHRVKMLGLEPTVEHFTHDDVIARYGDSCVYCGGEFMELDHYVPIQKGGPHTLENVRPSCTKCNAAKGAREDFHAAEARHE